MGTLACSECPGAAGGLDGLTYTLKGPCWLGRAGRGGGAAGHIEQNTAHPFSVPGRDIRVLPTACWRSGHRGQRGRRALDGPRSTRAEKGQDQLRWDGGGGSVPPGQQ